MIQKISVQELHDPNELVQASKGHMTLELRFFLLVVTLFAIWYYLYNFSKRSISHYEPPFFDTIGHHYAKTTKS